MKADPNCELCKGRGFSYVDGWAEDCECRTDIAKKEYLV